MTALPPFGHPMLAEFPLEPGAIYLNHGTVGVAPKCVLAAQHALHEEIERHPARFVLRESVDFVYQGTPSHRPVTRVRAAAARVARFLGTSADGLVFVDNTTSGANAVLQSFPFQPGDAVLVTDHGYGAITYNARHYAERAGASCITLAMPRPRFDRAAILAAFDAALTPQVKLVVVDHVTAPTALVMPVAEIVALAHARGARVLIDGAHALGALPLEIDSIGADWYTGNLHKWAFAPRSCAVLVTKPEWRDATHPSVISWGYRQGYVHEFEWLGTRDMTAYLAAPTALDFIDAMGANAMRAYQHALAWDSATRLSKRWQVELPMDESQVGSMVSVPLPERAGNTPADAFRIKSALLFEDGIEVHVLPQLGRLWLRISAQVYNEAADIDRLAEAVERHIGA